MGKTYVRVDDRLIHGQTMVAWCPALQIQQIIGVDDVSAANPMLKSIMTMSIPKMYKANIVTVQEAQELLAEPFEGNRLLIVKFPSKLMELKEQIRGCEHIYLGNMAKRADTNHQMTGATGIFYLSDQDIRDINELVQEGFNVTFQQLPNAGKVSWEAFTKSL